MNARQDWEKGTLILKPPRQRPWEVIVYNMKEGKHKCLEMETSKESESSADSSTSASESASQSSSECDSSFEVCRVMIKDPDEGSSGVSQKELREMS